MKTYYRILLLIFAIGFSVVAVAELNHAYRFLQKIQQAEPQNVEISEIYKCKLGHGEYLVKVLHADGSYNYEHAQSRDYSYVYDVGDKAKAYTIDDSLQLYASSNNSTAICFFFILLSLCVFLWSMLSKSIWKKGDNLAYRNWRIFFLIIFWMIIGLYCLGFYYHSHANVFYNNSIQDKAEIMGYLEKVCSRKEDDRTVKYPCFARQVKYVVRQDTFEKTESYKAKKSGAVGSWIDIHYLKANPNAFQTSSAKSQKMKSYLAIILAFVFTILWALAWNANRPVRIR